MIPCCPHSSPPCTRRRSSWAPAIGVSRTEKIIGMEEQTELVNLKFIWSEGRTNKMSGRVVCPTTSSFVAFLPSSGFISIGDQLRMNSSLPLHFAVIQSSDRAFRNSSLSYSSSVLGWRSLTGISFIVHVRLAAGRECTEEQFPLIMSPIRYRDWIPVIDGRCSGVSAKRVEPEKRNVKTFHLTTITLRSVFLLSCTRGNLKSELGGSNGSCKGAQKWDDRCRKSISAPDPVQRRWAIKRAGIQDFFPLRLAVVRVGWWSLIIFRSRTQEMNYYY